MIVKNESAIIKRCLDSVKHLIDYWIICDTGSTDNTKDIIFNELGDIPGNLQCNPWVNFSKNRTDYMDRSYIQSRKDMADIDYVLVMDADEILIDKGFDKESLTLDMYNLRYTGDLGYSYPVIFNAKKKWKYEYVTHEIPVPDFEGDYTTGDIDTLMLDHRHDGGTVSEKYVRDIALITAELEKNPHDARYLFYLAQSYFDIGDWQNAYLTYRRRIAEGGFIEEVAYSWYRAGLCALKLEPTHIVECMLNSYKTVEKAEPLYELGKYFNFRLEYSLADIFLTKAHDVKYPENGFFIENPVYEYLLNMEHAVTKYWLGEYHRAYELNYLALQVAPVKGFIMDQLEINHEFIKEKLRKK